MPDYEFNAVSMIAHPECGIPADTQSFFWAMISIKGPDDCWEFQGWRLPRGYGHYRIRAQSKSWLSHRLAYTIAKGPIPTSLLVKHSCDNPPCCNPAHLSTGDQRGNLKDAIDRGRGPTGEKHWTNRMREKVRRGDQSHNTKIPDGSVIEIFTLRKAGWLQKDIAKKFGVRTPAICRILSGKRRQGIVDSIILGTVK